MKRKRFLSLLAVLLLSFAFVLPVAAAEANVSESATQQTFYSLVAYRRMCRGQSPLYVLDSGAGQKAGYKQQGSVNQVQNLIDRILLYKKQDASLQKWIDSELARNVDVGSWYIIALSQSGSYDFSAYEAALLEFLRQTPPSAVQSLQKFALALIAAGSKDGIIGEIADLPVADSPVMAQVFGLHLLNNGIVSRAYTVRDVLSKLLAMQREDGGWALWGQNGDVDVTAMVLQALAPHLEEAEIAAAVNRAVAFLSKKQNADGSFSSMGKANCESTAQVITALSDLRIDCAQDARFRKNGNTPLDGLLLFRLADGGFSHLAPTKTVQKAQADSPKTETKKKATKQKSSDVSEEKTVSDAVSETPPAEEKTGEQPESRASETPKQEQKKEEKTIPTAKKTTVGYKGIAAAVLLLLALGAAALLLWRKKATRKNFLLLFLLLSAALLFVFISRFESVSTHKKIPEKSRVVGTVTLSVRCDTVAGRGDSDFIPKDGCMLEPTALEIEAGDTVYDVLAEATRRFDIHMEKKGADGMIYIAAIGHLYELQFGEMSGWVYHVNGESPFVGCDNYTVSDGDQIDWMYTLDLGADVGNSFTEEDE